MDYAVLSTLNLAIFTTVLMLVITTLIWISERSSRHLHTLEFWLAYLSYFIVSYLTRGNVPGIVALSSLLWIWRTRTIVRIMGDVIETPLWKGWHTIVIVTGYTLCVMLYFAGLNFTFFTMPAAIANFVIGVDVMYHLINHQRVKKTFSMVHKLLLVNVFLIFIHLLDYPFIRYNHEWTSFGFAIVLLTTILMAILLPAVSYFDLEKSHKEKLQQILHQRVEQLKEQSRFSALGEVTAGIVHEIDNPLSIITDRAGHLRHQVLRDRASKDTLMSDLNQIEVTSERMNKVIHSLKKFAEHSKTEPMQVVAVATVVEDTMSYCLDRFERANILLDIEPYPVKDIECKSIQISQVLLNLLNNSFDAVISKKSPWVRVVFEEDTSSIKIKVIDCGTGIPEVIRRKIFEPFFSTKVDGATGLGLSISKSIVEAHKGRLYYDESCPNTCFVVELPYRQG